MLKNMNQVTNTVSDKITTLETQLDSARSPFDKLVAMTQLAWELRYHDVNRSKTLTKDALDLADDSALGEHNRDIIIAHCSRNLAHFAYIDIEYVDAIAHAEYALSVYASHDLLAYQMHPLATLSNLQKQLGNYSMSLQHSMRQLEISETVDDPASKVDALNRIGVVYSLMGNYNKALDQYALCLPYYEAENDLNGQARIYNNCLIEYQNLKDNEKALDAGLKSLAMFEAADNLFGQSRIHGNLVRLYTQLQDYENAMLHSERALALTATIDNREHQMVNCLYIGQLYTQMGNDEQAIANFQTALVIAEDMNSLLWRYQCHESMAIAYQNMGDLSNALEHYKQFHALKEAVFNEESNAKLRNLEVSYRTQAVQHEAEIYRQRNEELEALREQDLVYFERLSEMKDELLRTASHDLKSPLSTLSMLVFMLKSNISLDNAGHELLQQIDHQIERMREFVIGVLDLAKLETGRALSIEPLPMVHYLKSIVQDFQPRADEKQITLTFATSDADIVAEFDPVEIRRVVENLLSNAIKFTPSNGDIRVSIDLTNEVIIRVSDTGVGIPKAAIPNVFDRFYRVNTDTHRAVDGTGLGLAIAKSIIEQHSGKIWLESVEGQGSTFSFSLQRSGESETADSNT